MLEPPKPGASQPLPASAPPPTSIVTGSISGNNNAKRAVGNNPQAQQPSSPRYPPREVPPRFRHQEQKQLLKRGQPLPGIAANLRAPSKLLNSQAGENTGTREQPVSDSQGHSSSQKQPGEREQNIHLSLGMSA